MPTAVVVATVIKTNMSETNFRNHALDQIRSNDRNLLATLADQDGEANVTTAILNVDEFMDFILQRFPEGADVAVAEQTDPKPKTAVVTNDMNEIEFMDQLADELQAGTRTPLVHLTDDELQAMEDESIGEHFSRNPFLY